MDNKDQLIETVDEQGNKVSFELVDIVSVDDIEYALLLPVGVQDNDEDEILVMRLKNKVKNLHLKQLKTMKSLIK